MQIAFLTSTVYPSPPKKPKNKTPQFQNILKHKVPQKHLGLSSSQEGGNRWAPLNLKATVCVCLQGK